MPLVDRYTDEIRTQLKRFANWEPGVPRALGDYGELRGSLFQREGNVAQLGVTFEVLTDPTAKHVSYASKGAVDLSADVGADADVPAVVKGKASLEVSFKAENAVLFNAAGVHYDAVSDHAALGRQILELHAKGQWNPRHSIVTEIARAGSTTVIISAGSSASILLVAEGDVPTIDLADASARFSSSMERNIGYKAIAEDGMVPLFGLARVRPNRLFWWKQPEFRKERGFQASGDDPVPPPDFQSSLDRDVDALATAARARAFGFDDAFELRDQQPGPPPGAGDR